MEALLSEVQLDLMTEDKWLWEGEAFFSMASAYRVITSEVSNSLQLVNFSLLGCFEVWLS